MMPEDTLDQYAEVIDQLRRGYDGSAADRDGQPKAAWKLVERDAFLARIRKEGRKSLLEIGAGTGEDSLFFQQAGLEVVATDLSPEMVSRCRAKGLDARTTDVLSLDFPEASFDTVWTINCLLHVPNTHFSEALMTIRKLLVPSGLLFLGVYGGEPFEGTQPDDWHEPPRFFSFRTDEEIKHLACRQFEMVDFHVVEPDGVHFQSLTLRRPSEEP